MMSLKEDVNDANIKTIVDKMPYITNLTTNTSLNTKIWG